MEITDAIILVGEHGWKPILSTAALLFTWHVTRPGSGRNRPLLALAVERVYGDLVRGLGVWWRYRREALEARRDRDRAIEAAYSDPDQGRPGQSDRPMPPPRPSGGGTRDTGRRRVVGAPPEGGGDRGALPAGAVGADPADPAAGPGRDPGRGDPRPGEGGKD